MPYVLGGALLMVVAVVVLIINDANEREDAAANNPTMGGHSHGGGGGGNPPPEMVQGSDGSGPMDISGVITLSPEMLKVAPSARAIYIIARSPDQPAGMPIAAVKLPASMKPIPYAIGPADVMNPEVPFSGPIQLSARWDTDGEASSKLPTDIIGGPEKNPVSPGSKGVDIILDTQLGAAGVKDPTKPAQAPASAPAAGGGLRIEGTITLDDSLKDLTPDGGFFFIIAYPAGVQGGPPLAVRKINASAEPTPFALGPEHMMGEGNFDQPMSLKVRWDQDGVTGMEAGDLLGGALEDPVKPGSRDVKMLLTRRK
jgi:hypothetical protein